MDNVMLPVKSFSMTDLVVGHQSVQGAEGN